MTRSAAEGTASADGPDAVPVCPRHPDRESYVRCQRCERPVCPDCQRPAAVGVQCVDCVREAARGTRRTRTVFGGVARGGRPVVTLTLIGLCAVAYVLQVVPGSTVTGRFVYAPFLTEAEPWRMITSAFLHSPRLPLHILFNLYALWMVAPYLEQEFGRIRFLALYLVSALGGSVLVLLLANPSLDAEGGRSWVTGVVGASGAVFGLFAAMVVVLRRLDRDYQWLVTLIVVNLVIGFIPGIGISWQGHLGGLITGAAVGAVLVFAPAAHRTRWQLLGVTGVTILLLALTAVKLSMVSPLLLA